MDKWRIDALLGRGGMASVYAATHRNGKRVARKFLNPELSAVPEIRTRFLREGYVANKVGHIGAVSVDDDDLTPDGAAFLVMELLEGETIEARRERAPDGRLPVKEVAELMDQVLDTLAAAHEQGVVHRDLKPENIFLTSQGVVKILDFGIARLKEGSPSKSATTPGTLMGTPSYLPPEQARGRWEEVDWRSDIWAVGATMFALLTGRCVHNADTVNEVLLCAMTEPAAPVRSIAPDIPVELAALVDRALAREKDARWPSARAMRAALRKFIQNPAAAAPARESEPTVTVEGVANATATLTAMPVVASETAVPTTLEDSLAPRAKHGRGPWLGVVAVGAVAVLAVGVRVTWLAWPGPPPLPVTAVPVPSGAPLSLPPITITSLLPSSTGPTVRPLSTSALPQVPAAAPATSARRARTPGGPRATGLGKPPTESAADPFAVGVSRA